MQIQENIEKLNALASEASAAAAAAATISDLEQVKLRFLGRKSELNQMNSELAKLDPADRKTLGQAVNGARRNVQEAIDARTSELESHERSARIEAERLDLTLPGRAPTRGRFHPLTIVADEIIDAFLGLGFKVMEGPIVETDYYNFEALNIPKDHSARSMHDTLYVEVPGVSEEEFPVVRTHTSPMQVRVMETTPPPIYVIIPGRVARKEQAAANTLASFSQIEGLAVDEGISFADMKGVLEVMAKAIFGPKQRIRMNPSYFPFTEPSAELYVSCFSCDGSGCRICKQEGWIEIMGAGMVHPNVFAAVGYDENVTGFAFGMGIERIAKLKYYVSDLRTFYENDVNFLRAF